LYSFILEQNGVGRMKAPEEEAKFNEVIFTVADWQGCLDDDQCAVPDDVVLRVFGPDVRAKLATTPAPTATGAKQTADAVAELSRFMAANPEIEAEVTYHRGLT
jgi:hypothetical protein